MNYSNKDISVIVPTYNRARSLDLCLRHLLNQTMAWHRYEIIIVDDGSTDQTRDVVSQYQSKNSLFLNYARQVNQGPATARNQGAKLASGKILFFIDDDCLARNDTLTNAYSEFTALKNDQVCLGGIKVCGRQNIIGRAIDLVNQGREDKARHIREIKFLGSSNLVVKRTFFLNQGGFSESFRCGEDNEWCFRIRQRGFQLVRSPKIVVCHQHQRNTLRKLIEQAFSWGFKSDNDFLLQCSHRIKQELSLRNRLELEFYLFFINRKSLLFILLFTFLLPFAAFLETVSFCCRLFSSRKDTLFLSPLVFIRFLSLRLGHSAYLLKKRKIRQHRQRKGISQIFYYGLNNKKLRTPAYLVLFVTNNCNARCGHCFYWKRTEARKEEMTIEQYKGLSEQLGLIEKISLTGGEPFLREDLASIAELFYLKNKVKSIGITSNGLCGERMVTTVKSILEYCPQAKLGVCLGLDGLGSSHDHIRGVSNAFEQVIDSYQRLKSLQKQYSQLNINLNFTLTNQNIDEFIKVYEFVKSNMPDCWPLNFSLLRTDAICGGIAGGPKDSSLSQPPTEKIKYLANKIIGDIKKSKRKNIDLIFQQGYFGHILQIIDKGKQIIPCLMGYLYAVVDESANVYFCEQRATIGNLNEKSFEEIWRSPEADLQRKQIKSRSCFCYNSFYQDLNIRYQLLHPSILKKVIGSFRRWTKQ